LFLLSITNIFSQNREKEIQVRVITHTVTLGETIRMISKKYLVKPYEIYALNPVAIDGISSGMVLKIPVPVKNEFIDYKHQNTADSTQDIDQSCGDCFPRKKGRQSIRFKSSKCPSKRGFCCLKQQFHHNR
jgi:LysM repeat protein